MGNSVFIDVKASTRRSYNRIIDKPTWGLSHASDKIAALARHSDVAQRQILGVMNQFPVLFQRMATRGIEIAQIEQGTKAGDIAKLLRAVLYSDKRNTKFDSLGITLLPDRPRPIDIAVTPIEIYSSIARHRTKMEAQHFCATIFQTLDDFASRSYEDVKHDSEARDMAKFELFMMDGSAITKYLSALSYEKILLLAPDLTYPVSSPGETLLRQSAVEALCTHPETSRQQLVRFAIRGHNAAVDALKNGLTAPEAEEILLSFGSKAIAQKILRNVVHNFPISDIYSMAQEAVHAIRHEKELSAFRALSDDFIDPLVTPVELAHHLFRTLTPIDGEYFNPEIAIAALLIAMREIDEWPAILNSLKGLEIPNMDGVVGRNLYDAIAPIFIAKA